MVRNRVFAGRYRLTEKVGTGGMAEVYKAFDEVLGRVVAVKVMLPQYAADATFTARFRQEAQAAANLSSPYIVNIYDWGQDSGTYFIVMEFVHGIELKRAIRERGALSERKVAELASQVCQALSVAHQFDIIHRDIKPQNIMVQPDGNAKVMDFGIARSGNSSLTTTNSVLGTAHYVSPEQAQGKKLTYASDLYSLGVVMYEAATGQLPFDAPDAVAVAVKQVNEEPVPPSQINPRVSPAFESIVMRALSKDPAQRFASALDMKNTIDSYLAGNYTGTMTAVMSKDKTRVMNQQNGRRNKQNKNKGKKQNNDEIGEQSLQYDEGKKGRRKKKGRKGLIAFLVILLLLLGGGSLYALNGGLGQKVPNVVGMAQADAKSSIEKAGFSVGTVSQENSSKVATGNVISQTPKGSTWARNGTRINLVISSGEAAPARVSIPNLSGMSETEAQAALASANLTPKRGEDTHSSTVKEGMVCEQSPEAGTEVTAGSTVTYSLSLGPDTVVVPSVTNMSQSDAVETLNGVGIEASATTEYDSNISEGYVIRQTPTAGTKIEVGSTVTIVVSDGPDPRTLTPSPEPEPPKPTPKPTKAATPTSSG